MTVSKTSPDLEELVTRCPKHIAVIMDGNRRWAKKQKFAFEKGHLQGAEQVENVVSAATELGVQILTLYALSTENLKRSRIEVNTLLKLLEKYLLKNRENMVSEGIRLLVIGDISKLPQRIQKLIDETLALTANGKNFTLVLALNYGGRDEICRAAKRFAKDCLEKRTSCDDLNEKKFNQYLDTHLLPDPDLLIRTSGEKRISNFLLWQISYSEVYITETLWPDFTKEEFVKAIKDYHHRKRRFGK